MSDQQLATDLDKHPAEEEPGNALKRFPDICRVQQFADITPCVHR